MRLARLIFALSLAYWLDPDSRRDDRLLSAPISRVIRKRNANDDIETQLASLEAQLRIEGQEIPAERMNSDSWRNSAAVVAGD